MDEDQKYNLIAVLQKYIEARSKNILPEEIPEKVFKVKTFI